MGMKKSLTSILFVLVLLLSACGGAEPAPPTGVTSPPTDPPREVTPTAAPADPTPQPAPTLTPRPTSPAMDGSFLVAGNEYFTAAGVCVICHNNNYDEAGNDVSLGAYWASSLMANSALDPYYLAGVSMNTARFPEYAGAIESKCSSCHMPLAHTSDVFAGNDSLIFGPEGYLNPDHPLHKLAVDGVSCTACHQIQDRNLGEFESFSGGFVIDQDTPLGKRVLYGRFDIPPQNLNSMAKSSGFTSRQSDHLLESEICATCHNLYTQYVTADGTFSEDYFAEQTPYSEWLHSDFATRSSCQDCHLPQAEGSVVLSDKGPAEPRSPFAKHSFTGGNAYLLGILKDYGGELGVQADSGGFQSAIDRSLALLQEETALVEISDPELAGGKLVFEVRVTNLTGHKFPTGYPSRRAWLQVTVKDEAGALVFASGRVGSNGAIAGNANDLDGGSYETHYDRISAPDQVQIYESIMTDVQDQVTTVLLAASSYVKDNRLLPAGFDKATAAADIRPYGLAVGDENFTAGTDTVLYEVNPGDASGPFSIEVELLYQSISYRWGADVSSYDTESARIFRDYLNAVPNTPVVIAASEASGQ